MSDAFAALLEAALAEILTFEQLPIGARFRHPGEDATFVKLGRDYARTDRAQRRGTNRKVGVNVKAAVLRADTPCRA